jgi:hypothetical protein
MTDIFAAIAAGLAIGYLAMVPVIIAGWAVTHRHAP